MDRHNNYNNNNQYNQRGRRPNPADGPMRDFHHQDYHNNNSGGGGRGGMNRRSRSRDRDYNQYNRFERRSRTRSRSRSRDRGASTRRGGGMGYDDRRDFGGGYPEDDYDSREARSTYSSSSSTHRNDRNRSRPAQEDHRGFDRRDRDKGYSRGNYSPNNSYQHGGHRNDYEDDYDSCESDSGNRYTSQTPQNKVIIQGLAQHITEADLVSDLMQYNLKPVSIHLIRRRNTGASRGFAFVEFSSTAEATRWMDYKQGVLMVQDQYRAVMQYSKSRGPVGQASSGGGDRSGARNGDNTTDWYCSKCLVFNFKRRENCFKCYASREESEHGGEGWDEISNVLTKKIILRNLDVLTNEEGVLTVLQDVLPLDQVAKISKILVCRDPLTNTSRGICYLSFDNLVDSMNVHNGLKGLENPLMMESREVGISYCLDGSNKEEKQDGPSGGSGNNSSLRNNNPRQSGNSHNSDNMDNSSQIGPTMPGGGVDGGQGANTYQYTSADVPRLAEYSAKLYATNPTEHEHYYKYYEQYYIGQIKDGQFANLPTTNQLGETANSGAAVAQSAMQRKQQQQQGRFSKSGHNNQNQEGRKGAESTAPPKQVPSGNDGKKYPVPDISQYQYEETSGYYFDPTTGLYYDANSQYYYNSEQGCYLYWDGENKTYHLAPVGTETEKKESVAETAVSGNKRKDQESTPEAMGRAPDKVKVAKKIRSDMEKWAKQLNQKKDMGGPMQLPVPVKEEHPLRQGAGRPGNGGCADVGFAILEKKDKLPIALEPMGPLRNTPTVIGGGSKIVAYGSDSDNEGDHGGDKEAGGPINEKDYVDFEKLTCLLCKRAFQSQEILTKHIKMSDLHKQNLAKYKTSKAATAAANDAAGQSYRDRAKERRKKYGEADPPPLNKSRERFHKEIEKQASAAALNAASSAVAATPIGGGNVGNKLLQKMGWQEGQGLGRSNQGRTNIIAVESRAAGSGLGTKTAGPPFAGGDYKTYIRKMMLQRYEQTE